MKLSTVILAVLLSSLTPAVFATEPACLSSYKNAIANESTKERVATIFYNGGLTTAGLSVSAALLTTIFSAGLKEGDENYTTASKILNGSVYGVIGSLVVTVFANKYIEDNKNGKDEYSDVLSLYQLASTMNVDDSETANNKRRIFQLTFGIDERLVDPAIESFINGFEQGTYCLSGYPLKFGSVVTQIRKSIAK